MGDVRLAESGVNGNAAGNAGGNGASVQNCPEIIGVEELAARLKVPKSWVANRTRARTPAAKRIPCLRFGKYVRFEWGSESLSKWLANCRD
jgi:hypothetical protein